MGRRSADLQSRNRALFGVFGSLVLLFLLIIAGLYLYNRTHGDPSSAYDQAISDCVRDRTRVSDTSGAQDRAASDCVRDTAPDSGR